MDLSRTLHIKNDLGLHARSAAKIARLAETARGAVYFMKDGCKVDATDILDMMGLYCPKGTEVTIGVVDSNDVEVLERIADAIESGFGES